MNKPRILSLLLAALLLTTTGVVAQISGGIFGSRAKAQIIEVCKSGCRYNTICNVDCTNFAAGNCAAGSALASITDSGPTKPYEVRIGPGVYDECVAIKDKHNLSLVGSGIGVTIIHPTVVAGGATNVDGGVLRIGNDTDDLTYGNNVTQIEVTGMTIVNDATSPPESAIQIGVESGLLGNTALWNHIYLHDLKTIGHHDSIQWYGSNDATFTDYPRLRIWSVESVGGRDNVVAKGWADVEIWDSTLLTQTNYCDSTDTDVITVRTDTVDATGATNTTFTLAATEDATENIWKGRSVSLSANTCAAGHDAVITDSDTLLVTFTPNAGFVPDATCTYTISALSDVSAENECTVDWTLVHAEALTGSWKQTCFHRGNAQTLVSAPSWDRISISNTTCTINANDFGFTDNSGGQVQVAGAYVYQVGGTHDYGKLNFNDFDITININTDLRDTATSYLVAGLAARQPVAFDEITYSGSITINSNADSDLVAAGIVVDSTGAAGGTVNINDVHVEFNGTLGTSDTIYESSSTATVVVNGLTSSELITSSGTITGEQSTICAAISPLNSESTFDDTILFDNSGRAFNVTAIGCRCQSPGGANCGTIAQIDYADNSGNPIGTTFTCADEGSAITWQDTRTDGDAALTAGEALTFSVNDTPATTLTNNYMICARYVSTKF